MALKYSFGEAGYDLFIYASEKCKEKFNVEANEKIWNIITNNTDHPITIATLYYYAREDNPKVYLSIIGSHRIFDSLYITHKGVSKYLHKFFPEKFIWTNGSLKCFNGHYWENNSLIMLKTISEELYDFLYDIQVERARQHPEKLNVACLNKLKNYDFMKKVVSTSEQDFTNNKIKFDDKWYLLPFENIVYDLKTHEFREHRYDDFISITTGLRVEGTDGRRSK